MKTLGLFSGLLFIALLLAVLFNKPLSEFSGLDWGFLIVLIITGTSALVGLSFPD